MVNVQTNQNVRFTHDQLIQHGREVIQAESNTIQALIHGINEDFGKACELLLAVRGRIIVIGMGKSGHIGGKIAATLASTGSPAFFVHPGEANHGDLGMVTTNDIILALSNSGETSEILTILPLIEHLKIPMISITGRPNSTLAKTAHVNLNIGVSVEACPLGLAPTSSTTATLVMGDAIALTLLQARGFTQQDYARIHPGGNLGKRLSLRIEDIMRKGDDIPKVNHKATLKDALLIITEKSLGMAAVMDDTDVLIGVFTDGDLRRTINKELDLSTTLIKQVMTANCKTITPNMLAFDALKLMETHKITSLLVVDDNGSLIGVAHMHDLFNAGL